MDAEQRMAASAGTDRPHPLEIPSSRAYVNQYGSLSIVGEVRNGSDLPMELVIVVATLYDAQGNVVATSSDFVSLELIAAGGTAPFDVHVPEFSRATQYRLQVQGSPATQVNKGFGTTGRRKIP